MQSGSAAGSTCKRPQFLHSHIARIVLATVEGKELKDSVEPAPHTTFS